jgi:hypothetical protein
VALALRCPLRQWMTISLEVGGEARQRQQRGAGDTGLGVLVLFAHVEEQGAPCHALFRFVHIDLGDLGVVHGSHDSAPFAIAL